MKKTDYRRKLFFDFPELIYERHLSRRQFIKAAGISAFGVALSSPMFLSCTKEHVEQFVNWIAELPELINDYRKKNGQPEIKGNLHSWSDNGNWQGKYGNGNWIGCCYPDDHSKKHCMWDKPKEITGYQGNGYEIAHHGSSTAQGALNSWKSSPD
jgi:hypothetical protein